jgi:peroxiredoxin Q/BCP
MYGKDYYGIKRTTFIIDENGRIVKIFSEVDPENHAEEVLKYL